MVANSNEGSRCKSCEYGNWLYSIEIATTIEATPVVHGRWIKDGDFLVCLNCESEINVKNSLGVENHKNYCPNCGAKMDSGVNE